MATFTRGIASALAAQAGIVLTKEQQGIEKEAALKGKIIALWMSNHMRCRCGLPLRMGRGKQHKEIDNPSYQQYMDAREKRTVTIEQLQNPPARKIKIPSPNYRRFWYMCPKGDNEGGPCNGMFSYWDDHFGGFVADPRFQLFKFMLEFGPESKGVPDNKTYDAIMALDPEAVRAVIDPALVSLSQPQQ